MIYPKTFYVYLKYIAKTSDLHSIISSENSSSFEFDSNLLIECEYEEHSIDLADTLSNILPGIKLKKSNPNQKPGLKIVVSDNYNETIMELKETENVTPLPKYDEFVNNFKNKGIFKASNNNALLLDEINENESQEFNDQFIYFDDEYLTN